MAIGGVGAAHCSGPCALVLVSGRGPILCGYSYPSVSCIRVSEEGANPKFEDGSHPLCALTQTVFERVTNLFQFAPRCLGFKTESLVSRGTLSPRQSETVGHLVRLAWQSGEVSHVRSLLGQGLALTEEEHLEGPSRRKPLLWPCQVLLGHSETSSSWAVHVR